MNDEIIKVIPVCIEKIGEIDPDRLRKIIKYALPFSVLGGTIYCIYKERTLQHEEIMVDKQYEHEEIMIQMKYAHEEKIAEIKANLLSRAEERKNEKDN